jgi:hypothetical protein
VYLTSSRVLSAVVSGGNMTISNSARTTLLLMPLLMLGEMGASPDTAPARETPATAYVDLNQRIPELKLEAATPLESALETLRDVSHANITVDWGSLQDAGVKRDAPVRIHLWNVTLSEALRAMIAVVDYHDLVSHEAQNGVIVVAAREKLWRAGRVVRVYDVRPIIDDLCGYRGLRTASTQSTGQRDTSGHGGPVPTLDEATEALVRIIQKTVPPEGWHDKSWSDDFARPFAGQLIVTQTPENHRKIADLLRTLREGGSNDGMQLFGK